MCRSYIGPGQGDRVNIDGVPIPDPIHVDLDIPIANGVFHFKDALQLRDAMLTLSEHNEDDILAWASARSVSSLFMQHYNHIDDSLLVDLPSDLDSNFFHIHDGEVELHGVPLYLGVFLDQDGLVVVGGRSMYVRRDLQVSTSADSIGLLRQAKNDDQRLAGFVTHLDYREKWKQQSIDVKGRDERKQYIACGDGVISTHLISQSQHKSTKSNRRHRLTMTYFSFGDAQEVANNLLANYPPHVRELTWVWQTLDMTSKSYKGRNFKYKTMHQFNYEVVFENEENGSADFEKERWHKVYGRVVQFFCATDGLPGTNYRSGHRIELPNGDSYYQSYQDLVTLYNLDHVASGEHTDGDFPYTRGTWATHRGMGSGHKIRWECR